jgi:2-isopropylmalate synthase
VVSGTVEVPTATVKLKIAGEEAKSAGFGVGPIDATFNTIAKMIGSSSKLMRFSVNAITGGMDAQGEVTVRLQENGLVALGKGADPDIITASAKAYINGLNRLEYLKNNPRLSPNEGLR